MTNLSGSIFKIDCLIIEWNSEHLKKKKRCKNKTHKFLPVQQKFCNKVKCLSISYCIVCVFFFLYWHFSISNFFFTKFAFAKSPVCFVAYRLVYYAYCVFLLSVFFCLRYGTLLNVMKYDSIVLQYVGYASLQVDRCRLVNFQDGNLLTHILDGLYFDFYNFNSFLVPFGSILFFVASWVIVWPMFGLVLFPLGSWLSFVTARVFPNFPRFVSVLVLWRISDLFLCYHMQPRYLHVLASVIFHFVLGRNLARTTISLLVRGVSLTDGFVSQFVVRHSVVSHFRSVNLVFNIVAQYLSRVPASTVGISVPSCVFCGVLFSGCLFQHSILRCMCVLFCTFAAHCATG